MFLVSSGSCVCQIIEARYYVEKEDVQAMLQLHLSDQKLIAY